MTTPSSSRVLYAAVCVLLLACGLLGGLLLGGSRTAPAEALPAQPGLAAARPVSNLPPELAQLMRTWMCPCGSCRDALLDCVCNDANGAREVTAYVRGLHADGVALEDIRKRAIDRYGATVVGGS